MPVFIAPIFFRAARSIYGCTQADYEAPGDVRYTQNGRRLYAHIFAYPFRALVLKGFADRIDYAQFLHDGSEILYDIDEKENAVTFHLPVIKPDVTVPVIEIMLK